MIPLPVGVTQWHRWVPVGGDLTLNLTDLRSWLLNCRSSPAGESYGSQLTGWAVTQSRISDLPVVPYRQDQSPRPDFWGSDVRHHTTEDDTRWVNYSTRRFSSRSTAF